MVTDAIQGTISQLSPVIFLDIRNLKFGFLNYIFAFSFTQVS